MFLRYLFVLLPVLLLGHFALGNWNRKPKPPDGFSLLQPEVAQYWSYFGHSGGDCSDFMASYALVQNGLHYARRTVTQYLAQEAGTSSFGYFRLTGSHPRFEEVQLADAHFGDDGELSYLMAKMIVFGPDPDGRCAWVRASREMLDNGELLYVRKYEDQVLIPTSRYLIVYAVLKRVAPHTEVPLLGSELAQFRSACVTAEPPTEIQWRRSRGLYTSVWKLTAISIRKQPFYQTIGLYETQREELLQRLVSSNNSARKSIQSELEQIEGKIWSAWEDPDFDTNSGNEVVPGVSYPLFWIASDFP